MNKMYAVLILALLLSPAALAEEASEAGVLALKVAQSTLTVPTECFDLELPAWKDAPENKIHFSRTPPVYATDIEDDGLRPVTSVRVLRLADESCVVRIDWDDATENLTGKSERYPDAGDAHIYKEQSEFVNAFADAVCLMTPREKRPHALYPSLMMGEGSSPMELYYWRAGLGFQLLTSHGRASTSPTGKSFSGMSARQPHGWVVLLTVPSLPSGSPVSFATWDGAKEQRDGLKFFSVWYEVD